MMMMMMEDYHELDLNTNLINAPMVEKLAGEEAVGRKIEVLKKKKCPNDDDNDDDDDGCSRGEEEQEEKSSTGSNIFVATITEYDPLTNQHTIQYDDYKVKEVVFLRDLYFRWMINTNNKPSSSNDNNNKKKTSKDNNNNNGRPVSRHNHQQEEKDYFMMNSDSEEFHRIIQREAVGRELEIYSPKFNKYYRGKIIEFLEETEGTNTKTNTKFKTNKFKFKHKILFEKNGSQIKIVNLQKHKWQFTDLINKEKSANSNNHTLATSKYMGVIRISIHTWRAYYYNSNAPRQQTGNNITQEMGLYLGTFATEKEAALAHDVYARKANQPTNFQEERWTVKDLKRFQLAERESLNGGVVGDNNKNKEATATHHRLRRRKKPRRKSTTSRYRGVILVQGRWHAQIWLGDKNSSSRLMRRLGTFIDEKHAALAYDAEARKQGRPTQQLNFPDMRPTPPTQIAAWGILNSMAVTGNKSCSRYRGVFRKQREGNGYRVHIQLHQQTWCLGTYQSEKQAALQYDRYGRGHGILQENELNFPRNVRLPEVRFFDDECYFCHKEAPQNPMATPCNHVFCASCVDEWFQQTPGECPCCQNPIPTTATTTRKEDSVLRPVNLIPREKPRTRKGGGHHHRDTTIEIPKRKYSWKGGKWENALVSAGQSVLSHLGKSPKPISPTTTATTTKEPKYPIGTELQREFDEGWFRGSIVSFDGEIYTVAYDDGDVEQFRENDFDYDDIVVFPYYQQKGFSSTSTNDKKTTPDAMRRQEENATDNKPTPISPSPPTPRFPVGMKFYKDFGELGKYEGCIASFDGSHYRVKYPQDGDEEELSEYEFDGATIEIPPRNDDLNEEAPGAEKLDFSGQEATSEMAPEAGVANLDNSSIALEVEALQHLSPKDPLNDVTKGSEIADEENTGIRGEASLEASEDNIEHDKDTLDRMDVVSRTKKSPKDNSSAQGELKMKFKIGGKSGVLFDTLLDGRAHDRKSLVGSLGLKKGTTSTMLSVLKRKGVISYDKETIKLTDICFPFGRPEEEEENSKRSNDNSISAIEDQSLDMRAADGDTVPLTGETQVAASGSGFNSEGSVHVDDKSPPNTINVSAVDRGISANSVTTTACLGTTTPTTTIAFGTSLGTTDHRVQEKTGLTTITTTTSASKKRSASNLGEGDHINNTIQETHSKKAKTTEDQHLVCESSLAHGDGDTPATTTAAKELHGTVEQQTQPQPCSGSAKISSVPRKPSSPPASPSNKQSDNKSTIEQQTQPQPCSGSAKTSAVPYRPSSPPASPKRSDNHSTNNVAPMTDDVAAGQSAVSALATDTTYVEDQSETNLNSEISKATSTVVAGADFCDLQLVTPMEIVSNMSADGSGSPRLLLI